MCDEMGSESAPEPMPEPPVGESLGEPMPEAGEGASLREPLGDGSAIESPSDTETDAAIDELGGPETAGDTLDDVAVEPESNNSGDDFDDSQLESPTDPLDETSDHGEEHGEFAADADKTGEPADADDGGHGIGCRHSRLGSKESGEAIGSDSSADALPTPKEFGSTDAGAIREDREAKWDAIEGLDGDKWLEATPAERVDSIQDFVNIDCDDREVPHAEVQPGDGDAYNGDWQNPIIYADSSRLSAEYETEDDAALDAAGAINAAHHEVDHYARDYAAKQGTQEQDPYLSPEQRAGAPIGDEGDGTRRAGASFGDNYYNWPDERKARESESDMIDYIRNRYDEDVAARFEHDETPGPVEQPGRISMFKSEENQE